MLSREILDSPVFETESLESFWERVRQGNAVPDFENPFCMLSHEMCEGFLEYGSEPIQQEPSREFEMEESSYVEKEANDSVDSLLPVRVTAEEEEKESHPVRNQGRPRRNCSATPTELFKHIKKELLKQLSKLESPADPEREDTTRTSMYRAVKKLPHYALHRLAPKSQYGSSSPDDFLPAISRTVSAFIAMLDEAEISHNLSVQAPEHITSLFFPKSKAVASA